MFAICKSSAKFMDSAKQVISNKHTRQCQLRIIVSIKYIRICENFAYLIKSCIFLLNFSFIKVLHLRDLKYIHMHLKRIRYFPISGQTLGLYQQNLYLNIFYFPKVAKLGFLNFGPKLSSITLRLINVGPRIQDWVLLASTGRTDTLGKGYFSSCYQYAKKLKSFYSEMDT